MKVEVLGSVMNQRNLSIVKKMNIKTDAILINQSDALGFTEMDLEGGYKVKMYSFNERGVGLSRNNALMRAKQDIILFADEDETFVDNYEDIIIKAFEEQKDADIIFFNVPSKNPKRKSKMITKNKRLSWYNCLRYGAVRIAAKRDKIISNNIFFALLFGGGAEYSNGEDSIFIKECIDKGLKLYANSNIIGYVAQENSTWFEGYYDKYYIDRGALYAYMYKRMPLIYCIQFLLRNKVAYKEKGIIASVKLMNKGIKEMRKRRNG